MKFEVCPIENEHSLSATYDNVYIDRYHCFEATCCFNVWGRSYSEMLVSVCVAKWCCSIGFHRHHINLPSSWFLQADMCI
jgi:hypothetical protein